MYKRQGSDGTGGSGEGSGGGGGGGGGRGTPRNPEQAADAVSPGVDSENREQGDLPEPQGNQSKGKPLATKPESQGNQLKGNDKPLAKKPELRGDAPMKPQKPQPPHEDAADKQSYAKTDKDKVKTADEVNNENWQCMNCGHEGKLSPRGKCEACGSDAVDSVLPGQPERARHAVASKKFADTADNPANEKGGEGAMLPKTDKDLSLIHI